MSADSLALPALVAVLAWWISTGLVLLLVRWTLAGHGRIAPVLAVYGGLALAALPASAVLARIDTPQAAYAGFGLALFVWGWHEASFLTGAVTGPRPHPCPPGAHGVRRFAAATLAVIHHEAALALTLAVLAALCWGAPNPSVMLTFAVLFVMRLSAKLNLFVGVPHLTDDFMPVRIAHLKTYFPRKRAGTMMTASITGGLALCIGLAFASLSSPDVGAGGIALGLASALTLLAVVEHGFMLVPIRDSALWRWAQASKDKAAVAKGAAE